MDAQQDNLNAPDKEHKDLIDQGELLRMQRQRLLEERQRILEQQDKLLEELWEKKRQMDRYLQWFPHRSQ